jgi:hypothetical protein
MADEEFSATFAKSKKKDDLADAFLLNLVTKNYLKRKHNIENN